MESKNIMIVGVGGQGTLLASKLLGRILLENGYDVKVSEVHGMSQRGGSVVTYVKYGDKVYSPVIELGEADMIISFEQLEAGRWLPYLKKGGTVKKIGTASLPPGLDVGEKHQAGCVRLSLQRRPMTFAAAAEACATVSGISFGP